MSDKPSYLGLLNAIAEGERHAAEYLGRWAETTPDSDVRSVLRTVMLREAEHAAIFAKRIDELGYSVIERREPGHNERMTIAASTEISDREKLERFRLHRARRNGESDVFDRFFEDKDIDPVTGGLLGRYIAEERDTGRRFEACYLSLGGAIDAPVKAPTVTPRRRAATPRR